MEIYGYTITSMLVNIVIAFIGYLIIILIFSCVNALNTLAINKKLRKVINYIEKKEEKQKIQEPTRKIKMVRTIPQVRDSRGLNDV